MVDVLITDETGFVGTHFARHLANQDYDIRVFDSLYSVNGDNVQTIRGNSTVKFVCGDIQNYHAVRDAMEDVKPKYKGRDIILSKRKTATDHAKDILGFEIEASIQKGPFDIVEWVADKQIEQPRKTAS